MILKHCAVILIWSKKAYSSSKIVNNSVRNDDRHFRLLVCFDSESLRKDMFVSHKCIMFGVVFQVKLAK